MRATLLAGLVCLVGSAGWAQAPPETDCDRRAGLWMMPRLDGGAQVYDIPVSQAPAAIAACEAAVAAYPETAYFAVLLARALIVANPGDPRALRLLRAASESLPAVSAAQIGALYELGQGGLGVSDRSARSFYEQACQLWPDPSARPGCAAHALMVIEGRGGPADEAAGFATLSELCRSGWPMACTDMAQQQELRGSESETEIAATLGFACEGGDLLGCSLLGFRYEIELGVPRDMARARSLYALACDGGEVHGCANLGEVYRAGLGVVQDIPEAARLFGLACDGNDPFACVTLGGMLADGRGVSVDIPRAIELLDRACWQGDPEACDMADGLR
ncbi:tetratricopeptide repeat protein [Pararhodobacter sp.]|uniref:tetratricopeptide repeat protein n=1 Tax=Pararhodobacter sp. TaxID=2127056 RepID=UPI002AFDCBA7|nr:tetratricopeptide repeat protein [Pararhodobacter sp.]